MTTDEIAASPSKLDPRTRWAVVAMAAAALMAVLSGTTVTTTLESLAPELGTTFDGVVWVTTAYLVAAAAAVPLVGWLSARIGAERVVLVSLVGFAAGSLLTGLAWDLGSVLAFRAVQGVAGGLLEPAALAAIGLVTPRERMGRVMGGVSLVINIGPVAGPLLGGAIVGAGAWQWMFWINVPLAAIVGFGAWRLLPTTERSAAGRVDAVGLATLPPGFVLALLALNRWGAGAPPWLVASLAIVGAALLAAYTVHALRVPEPLLDIRLLRHGGFAAALLVMGVVGLTMYTLLSALPLLAAQHLGMSGGWSAVPVAVLGVGLMVSMTLAGRWSDAVGARVVVRSGAIGTAVTAGALWLGQAMWPVPAVLALVLVLGLAFGAIASPTFASIYRVLPTASIPQGTASLFIVVQLLASVGVTLVGFLTATEPNPARVATGLIAALAVGVAVAARWLPSRQHSA